jgi:hypothetical protein
VVDLSNVKRVTYYTADEMNEEFRNGFIAGYREGFYDGKHIHNGDKGNRGAEVH